MALIVSEKGGWSC